MKDEISSIKTTVYERLASPLTGSFIISWLIINWRVVLAIFSSEKYVNKVAHIYDVYSVLAWPWWFYVFVLPAIGAILYVFVYQWIVVLSLRAWTYTENAKKLAQKKRYYTQEELDKEIKTLEKIIEGKNNTIQADRQTVEHQKQTISEIRNRLNDSEKEVARVRKNSDERIADIQLEISQVRNELGVAREKKVNAEEKFNNAVAENRKLVQAIDPLKTELQDVKKKLEIEADTNEDYVNDIKNRDNEIVSLKADTVKLENGRLGAFKALIEIKNILDEIIKESSDKFSTSKLTALDKKVTAEIESLIRIIKKNQIYEGKQEPAEELLLKMLVSRQKKGTYQ